MKLISKNHHQTTIEFTTVELINIRKALTGLIQEYDSVDEEIIGVTKDYLKTLETNLYAFREEAIS